jgi:pimeloyl-ACP methyl ester carboxylesterase
MTDFLLIHGSCHGAWCWRDTIPALLDLGHNVRAIDLPGQGNDPTPPKDVTLELYRDAVLAASSPDTVIVGHSMAGYPIAAAAEHAPDAMRGLVFLCAYAPVSGQSLAQMRRAAPRQTLMAAIQRSDDAITFSIDPAQAEALFYHDCPTEAVAYAIPRLGPQAVLPQETPLTLGDNYAAVPKAYIRCANDQTIPPEYQTVMAQDFAPDKVHHMQSSHSPFFSDPIGLAALLDQIAKDM